MSQLNVSHGTFAELKDLVMPIRIQVFVDEQNVPVEIEQDDRDPVCVHALARVDGQPVATGRIDIEAAGKIGRIAVLKEFRRQRIGQAVMHSLEQIARENSLPSLFLNSQLSAKAFYESLGYTPVGNHFMEANIEHVKMVKQL